LKEELWGLDQANIHLPERVVVEPVKFRRAAQGNEPTILADIYQEDTNIVIWKLDFIN
jgi:hypothetical protein